MSVHPYVKALLGKLAADAELKSEQLDMRRLANKSMTGLSSATRLRLAEEARLQSKIAHDIRALLELADKV